MDQIRFWIKFSEEAGGTDKDIIVCGNKSDLALYYFFLSRNFDEIPLKQFCS